MWMRIPMPQKGGQIISTKRGRTYRKGRRPLSNYRELFGHHTEIKPSVNVQTPVRVWKKIGMASSAFGASHGGTKT